MLYKCADQLATVELTVTDGERLYPR